jgi:hypothetical protein
MRQPAPPAVASFGNPRRSGNMPCPGEGRGMTRVHPALAELLLLLAFTAWLRLASGLG